MEIRKTPNTEETQHPLPKRALNAGERFLSELFQQAASMDMAPAHTAPLARKVLRKRRGTKGARPAKEPLSVDTILSWADAYHQREGRWPGQKSGPVADAPGESWPRIDAALRSGRRGLTGGSSLANLLAERRGHRNVQALPPLTEEQILAWVDAYRERHGRWPNRNSGAIDEAPGQTWTGVDVALKSGARGLAGGKSLPKLLAEHREHRNPGALPPYTVKEILAWADAFFARHARWPKVTSGPIEDAPGETWRAVERALRSGHRGLPGGSTLARLLAKRRGVPNHYGRPALAEKKILAWADAHREKHRMWPSKSCGDILGTAGESWSRVDNALHVGLRGLTGGDSLSKLLARRRGKTVRRQHNRPTLTEEQILAWVDAWKEEYGRLPSPRDKRPIPGAEGENWNALDVALKTGVRGLPGGDSLARLLRRHGRKPSQHP